MTEQEKVVARLENAERALFGLVAIIQDTQPLLVQESLSRLMAEYFDATTGLGMQPIAGFVTCDS